MQHLAPGHRHDQLAILRQSRTLDTGKAQRDRRRIRTRRHHKVIFQLARIAIQHPVDARIHLLIAHLGEIRHIGPPLLRITAQIIMTAPGQRPCTHQFRLWIDRTLQAHPHHRSRSIRIRRAQGQHRFPRGQGQLIAGHPRQETHIRTGLALIRLEMQGRLAEQIDHPRPHRRWRRLQSRRNRRCRWHRRDRRHRHRRLDRFQQRIQGRRHRRPTPLRRQRWRQLNGKGICGIQINVEADRRQTRLQNTGHRRSRHRDHAGQQQQHDLPHSPHQRSQPHAQATVHF